MAYELCTNCNRAYDNTHQHRCLARHDGTVEVFEGGNPSVPAAAVAPTAWHVAPPIVVREIERPEGSLTEALTDARAARDRADEIAADAQAAVQRALGAVQTLERRLEGLAADEHLLARDAAARLRSGYGFDVVCDNVTLLSRSTSASVASQRAEVVASLGTARSALSELQAEHATARQTAKAATDRLAELATLALLEQAEVLATECVAVERQAAALRGRIIGLTLTWLPAGGSVRGLTLNRLAWDLIQSPPQQFPPVPADGGEAFWKAAHARLMAGDEA